MQNIPVGNIFERVNNKERRITNKMWVKDLCAGDYTRKNRQEVIEKSFMGASVDWFFARIPDFSNTPALRVS
jgi:hypothetical protein